MKLYLSSFRLGDNPENLVKLFGHGRKIAVIANSIDNEEEIVRDLKIAKEIEGLNELGLNANEFDLRNYFGVDQNNLNKDFAKYDGAWVRGGNVFVLRRAFAQSGFDKLVLDKAKNSQDFVYAGYSAGGCILSPTLHGYEIVDDPLLVPTGYLSEIIWEGLAILDYYFVPHYKSEHPESHLVDQSIDYMKREGLRFKTLHDGEVIIE